MRKSNLTYEELIELAPKDRPFQIGFETTKAEYKVWGFITNNKDYPFTISTFSNNAWNDIFNAEYKGTFTLIDEYRNMYEKPDVLKVGTEVEILESIKDALGEIENLPVGGIAIIEKIVENNHGLKYRINTWYVPHYCVRPVEKVKENKEIITVNGKKYKLIEEYDKDIQ